MADFIKDVQIIPPPLPAELAYFEDALGIDMGEAIIFAATAGMTDFVVTTGDKVSLKSLASTPECQPVVARLVGRVLCFEQIVQKCVGQFGFDAMKKKIVPAVECDKAIRAIFGSGFEATAESVADGLNSYIQALRSVTGALLMP